MSKSPNYLIDTNVWVALFLRNHPHHLLAEARVLQLREQEACFCRATQKGLFRLLTQNTPTYGHPLPMIQCWELYEDVCASKGILFLEEPQGLEKHWRALTSTMLASPKLWMDAYLQAFAELAGLKIITFDRALAKASGGECLLGE
jgi:hypothetical protein